MIILALPHISIAGISPHTPSIHRESLRDPATWVRAGPGRPWRRHDRRPSSRTRTVAEPRAPCP